jgi:hypothetical protein
VSGGVAQANGVFHVVTPLTKLLSHPNVFVPLGIDDEFCARGQA